MEDDESQVIELYELNYSDLILLSSSSSSMNSPEEIQRLKLITRNVMQNLGPTGPGLLAITGVPKAPTLRQALLPLARELALISDDHRKRILKEHNLGSDVPLKNQERIVSSFAMQLKCKQDQELSKNETQNDFHGEEFNNLGLIFKDLGLLMMEIGVRVAKICDEFIGGNELEESLLESRTAKGRLIHYHSYIDNMIIKESMKQKDNVKQFNDQSNLWQQWHYDYGILTVFTSPMFLLANNSCVSNAQECASPSGHTYLQIFDPEKDCVFKVKACSESFIVQVGESADVLSKGKLRATLHSVCRPEKAENLSRETFVVFLQPAWNKTFCLTDYPMKRWDESVKFHQDIKKIIPPLASRLKDGMTFAEFSKETTKKYYSGKGVQSKRYV